MSTDLLIKINADAANAKKAFDDVKAQTEDLEKTLAQVATASGVAFAAFTATIYLTEKAFVEAQKSSIQLTNALQNQGIYTRETVAAYRDYADVVQAATGIDNDAVISAQAVAQTYLGQTKITQELTNAIADLGEYMNGDLNSAAEKIARTIGTGTNAFAKQGLVIQDGATEAERYARVMEFVQLKAGGLAEDMGKIDGNARRLATSFGNAQEALGARFAPAVAFARGVVASFFDAFDKYPILADVAASVVVAGTVVTGLVAASALGVIAFANLSAAAATFGVTLNIALAGIPIAIAAIIAGITLLALNWGKAVDFIKSAVLALTTFVNEAFTGLSKIISGAMWGSPSQIQEGLNQLKGAYAKARDISVEHYTELKAIREADQTEQDAKKKAAADKEAAQERAHQANLRAIKKEENALLKLQNENASEEIIQLKQKEIETLKALDAESNANTRLLLQERLEIIRELEAQKQVEDLERQQIFAQQQRDLKVELAQQDIEVSAELGAQKLAQLQAQVMTEADVDRKIQEEILKKRIDTNNKKLIEQKKYGEAFAIINKALQSDEVQGFKGATDELVKLTQSKNQDLKRIGKAAAVAQIGIATAESAMNIYRGFSAIPFIGPALGIAGAAAAIAFGGERITEVLGAADGGLVEGGIPGRDSVPAMLMGGELVVPRQNFDEVVGAVRSNRQGAQDGQILEALKNIEKRLASGGQVNNFYGDVVNDEAFVDNFVKRISDSLEFRNTKLFGVTT